NRWRLVSLTLNFRAPCFIFDVEKLSASSRCLGHLVSVAERRVRAAGDSSCAPLLLYLMERAIRLFPVSADRLGATTKVLTAHRPQANGVICTFLRIGHSFLSGGNQSKKRCTIGSTRRRPGSARNRPVSSGPSV